MVNVRKTDAHPNASTKDMTLIATVYDKSSYTNPKTNGVTRWADVQAAQIEGANPHLKPQTQPHLFLQDSKDQPGRKETTVAYSQGQIDAMAAASGANTRDIVSQKDGSVIGKAYVFNADIMFEKGKPGLVNTKSIKEAPEGLVVPENVVDAQFQAVKENRAEKAAAKANEVPAPQAEAPQAEAPQADAEPSFG